MDTQMMDVDGDVVVDIDIEPAMEMPHVQQAQSPPQAQEAQELPAAYYENLEEYRPIRPIPETLNLQGVSDFGPNEPLDWALEHCRERRPKRVRWINDNSVNIEYYSPDEAADALLVLTHPDVERAATVPPQTARKAVSYSKKPDSTLTIREANTGDQKERNAADRSQYYRRNPDVREQKLQRRRREERDPSPVVLDYGDEGAADTARRGSDDAMSDGEHDPRDEDRRGPRQPNRRGDRGRKDVDSYRPRSHSPRESRFGRLRGRSASPDSGEDGRFGFDEPSTARRYRSRSRDNQRRQRSRSRSREVRRRERGSHLETDRWEKDRFDPNQSESGRWVREGPVSPMSRHRRSDATDETNNKGSLLSRMTKDGKPVAGALGRSLASRITRDGPDDAVDDEEPSYTRPKRGFANRVTRDDNPASHFNRSRSNDNYGRLRDDNYGRRTHRVKDESYGRLKDDDSAPRETDFQEPTSGPGNSDLLSRMTWSRDRGGNDESPNRGADQGFSIKGTAAPQVQMGGFSIRGAAGGD